MADKTVLRILCIHGYRQNEQTFRENTGAFRKIIKKHAELVFITAPNKVPVLASSDDEGPGGSGAKDTGDDRGWWFSRPDAYYHAHDYTDCSNGYEESLQLVRESIEKQGPFDGVLGFSQGASMVSLMCGLKAQGDPTMKFHFVILIAGFKSRQSTHCPLYTHHISLPSLHVFGDTDKVIQKEMSEELLTCYEQPKVISHPGGHFVPASSAQKKVYLEFLSEMVQQKQQREAESQ